MIWDHVSCDNYLYGLAVNNIIMAVCRASIMRRIIIY
jgi:hypothetical protein